LALKPKIYNESKHFAHENLSFMKVDADAILVITAENLKFAPSS